MMNNLGLSLSVIAAMITVQAAIIGAHHIQRRIGTMLLGAVAATAMFGVWLFAGMLPVLRLSDIIQVPLISVVLYNNLLASILIVYICDGTKQARRFLLILFISSILAIGVQELIRAVQHLQAVQLLNPMAEDFLQRDWQVTLAAVLALLFAFLLVVFSYQFLTNELKALPRPLRLGLVLVWVFLVDGMLFILIGFMGHEDFSRLVVSQFISEIASAIVLAPGVAWYITRELRSQAENKSEVRPVFEVVSRETEIDREINAILATMVEGFIMFSSDGKVLRANPAAERLIGRPLKGLRLDDPALSMTNPDGTRFPLANSPLVQSLRDRRPVENAELGIPQEDHTLRHISVNVSPMMDAQGRPRGAVAILRDITQRKETDESLAASTDFLKRLIDEAPIGIAVFDAEGEAEHLNKAFLNFLGVSSPNELIGEFNIFRNPLITKTGLLSYVVKAYKGAVVEIPPAAFDVGRAERYELNEIASIESSNGMNDGKLKVVSQLLFPVHDRFGKVRNVVDMLTDLTERTKAELGRSLIEKRYEDMAARISDYLFSAKVERGGMRYEFCTPVVEKITGYPGEFFLNDNWFWFTIIDGQDKQRVQDELLRLLSSHNQQEGVIEYRIRSRKGEMRWVQSRFTIIRNPEGQPERLLGAVSDISSRKETEEALRKTVKKLRSLVETMHEFVIVLDLQGKITYVNQTFKQVMGYSERHIIGQSFYQYAHASNREEVQNRFDGVAATKEPLRDYELRFRKSSGEYLLLAVNADPLHEEEDNLSGILTVSTNITERKWAEQTVRQRNSELLLMNQLGEKFRRAVALDEVFQVVYDLLPHAMGIRRASVLLWDDNRRQLVHNGSSPDGHEWETLHANDISQQCFESAQTVVINDYEAEAMASGNGQDSAQVKSVAAVPIMAEGRAIGVLRVEDTETKHRFGKDSIEYLQVIAHQLSLTIQNVRTYEQIRRSEENYRSIFDNAADGIYRATLAGDLIAVNQALVRMLGYGTVEEVLKLCRERDLFHKSEEFDALRSLVIERDFVHGFETRFKRLDGSVIEVRINVRQIRDSEGILRQVEADVDDVTEERRLRERLLQAQKLEGLGRLTAGLAHDFNNILNAIMSNLSLAKSSTEPETAALKFMQEAESAANRGADLIHRMLTFSRTSGDLESYLSAIQSGQRALAAFVDLNQAIAEIIALLRPTLDPELEVNLRLQENLWPVQADSSQVSQLVLNLTVNAREALSKKAESGAGQGSLTFSTENLEADQAYRESRPHARPGKFVRLTISDTGIGMEENVQKRMFEPFFTTKEIGEGAGLGLAVVYGIVHQLRGWIDCTSKMGEGTTFEVHLPAAWETGGEA